MTYLAHSAKKNIREQTYEEHVSSVLCMAFKNAERAAKYTKYGELLKVTVERASLFHDLGKLDKENQKVLQTGSGSLPIKHWDAGAAHWLSQQAGLVNNLAALFVYSHHIGLPSLPCEGAKGTGNVFRVTDSRTDKGEVVREHTNKKITEYLKAHESSSLSIKSNELGKQQSAPTAFFMRMALSCLVDADHTDTARHYQNIVPGGDVPLIPDERLCLLDKYVAGLSENTQDKIKRNELRQDVYNACRNAGVAPDGMIACDSPVGTGKTTAIMAHLLNVAQQKSLRRIFVVLPFTNIIDQSVEVYKKALVIDGENSEKVIAAHHHKAEFESEEARAFSFLWNAPITVTTAVQFFETLASNHPATLRKLHELAGSAIFLDEAHAALPAHLWPQAWKWLRELIEDWGCYIVLASGSLTRFWELPEFANPTLRKEEMPELVSDEVRKKALAAETIRVRYERQKEPFTMAGLCDWITSLPGPRLVILNTVHSASAVADDLRERHGRGAVENISTALAPIHREATIKRIKERLLDKNDLDWTLVATSCVEAGVNFSFKTAARELCSLVSTIQTAGRINRSGEHGESVLWNFKITQNDVLRAHPAFQLSASILENLFEEDKENKVTPEYCKEAMKREIRRRNLVNADDDDIVKKERSKEFPDVNEMFNVISTNTVFAVIDNDLIERLERQEKVSAIELQRKSVNIYTTKINEFALKPIAGFRKDLYAWNLGYDDFLGYMAGVLKLAPDPNNYCL